VVVPPEHTVISDTALTIGVAFMVIVNVFVLAPALVQAFATAVTVTVPTMSTPVLLAGAVPVMSPLPDANTPIAVFVFVQLMVAPATLLVNGMLITSPAQNDALVIVFTTG
jgi:hypothetical protein